MSFSISTLLIRNLHDVFGENDPARRRAAIDEIFSEDCVFYEPRGVHRGRDEIDRVAGAIKATHPDFRYQPIAGPEELGNGGATLSCRRCRTEWPGGSCSSGHPPGASPAAPGHWSPPRPRSRVGGSGIEARRTHFMASKSIDAPRNWEACFLLFYVSRGSLLTVRVCCTGGIPLASLSSKLDQTHFQGQASAPFPRADTGEA